MKTLTSLSTVALACFAIELVMTDFLTTSVQAGFFDLETKITASDPSVGAVFGSSVAVSGNVALVGADREGINSLGSGSAYLFDTTTGNQLAKLVASDSSSPDGFGWSVAISGNVAVVGAPYDDDMGNNSGSVYLFDVSTGNQLAKLTASDAAAGDGFGRSVAISGDMALVGAPFDGNGGFGGFGSGSAYLFDVTSGNQLAKLTASDASTNGSAGFGWSVDISGDRAIVGASAHDSGVYYSGSAYLFDVTTGNQLAKLTAPDAAQNVFGYSVAINDDTALVGAPGNRAGIRAGSAYLFDVTTGNQLAKLTASDAFAGDAFGTAVALSENMALVGAPATFIRGSVLDDDRGSAYLFDSTTGNQFVKLTASDPLAAKPFGRRAFGRSVAISGNTVIVGAELDDDGPIFSGSAYLFENTVPEPTSLLLATLAGLFGLGNTHRRRD